MTLQNFVDKSLPVVSAAWLNQVDVLKETVFAAAATKALARVALTSDAPWSIGQGGTGATAAGLALLTGLGLNQAIIAALLNPLTSAENAAGIVAGGINALFPPGNIMRYGADPTGATTSLTAFTNAIAQSRQTGGANVTIPAGTFSLGAGFSESGAVPLGLNISGAGKSVTVLTSTAAALGFGGTLYQDMKLENFGITSPGACVSVNALRGGSLFRNLRFNGDVVGKASTGITITGDISAGQQYSGEFEVENCEFYSMLTGFSFLGKCTGGSIYDSRFTNSSVNIPGSVGIFQDKGCFSQNVVGCQIQGFKTAGISTQGMLFRQHRNYFEANNYGGGGHDALWALGAGNSTIGNSSIDDENPSTGLDINYTASAAMACSVLNSLDAQGGVALGGKTLSVGLSSGTGTLGLFGATAVPGPQGGWGTPTGAVTVANFPGATATLLQTSEALAQLLTYLKSLGILGT